MQGDPGRWGVVRREKVGVRGVLPLSILPVTKTAKKQKIMPLA